MPMRQCMDKGSLNSVPSLALLFSSLLIQTTNTKECDVTYTILTDRETKLFAGHTYSILSTDQHISLLRLLTDY